jgi:hypothetical protein
MNNYDYLKQRVLELNLQLTECILKDNKYEVSVIKMLMSYYIDKMIETKKITN